ncbi:MAG: Uma2 family endonuclease [Bacteroidia bacterium]|nr:Uma2 family endonuclease [Bacteroidia bacterium]
MAEPASKLSYSTPEAYLEAESASSSRHEYQDGLILDMAGGSIAHERICANLYGTLYNQLAGKPCSYFSSNMKLHVQAAHAFYYPDASVICGEPQRYPGREDALTDATVIIEVLSPSTEAQDRGEKFMSFQLLPGLMEYVLIHQRRIRAEIYQRQQAGHWLYKQVNPGELLTLDSIQVSFPLDILYQGVQPDSAP